VHVQVLYLSEARAKCGRAEEAEQGVEVAIPHTPFVQVVHPIALRIEAHEDADLGLVLVVWVRADV
tara:strand:- start:362 stop:559 length:198 start_codon:yes stop_codon:yes gene_type:complete